MDPCLVRVIYHATEGRVWGCFSVHHPCSRIEVLTSKKTLWQRPAWDTSIFPFNPSSNWRRGANNFICASPVLKPRRGQETRPPILTLENVHLTLYCNRNPVCSAFPSCLRVLHRREGYCAQSTLRHEKEVTTARCFISRGSVNNGRISARAPGQWIFVWSSMRCLQAGSRHALADIRALSWTEL